MRLAPLTSFWGLLAVVTLLAGCRAMWPSDAAQQSAAASRQLSQQGLAALDRGELFRAEALLGQAVQACPEDWQARCYYAEALWLRGAAEDAMAQIAAVGDWKTTDATSAVRIGNMLLEMNELAKASALADQALDVNPQLSTAWALRGRLHRARGEHQLALADLHRALDFDPSDADVLLEVAELYRHLNEPQRALATLQHLSDLYPPGEESPQVLYLTGLAYSALARHEQAVEALAAAVARGKPSAEMLCRLAEAELHAGRREAAGRTLRQALATNAGHGPSLALLEHVQRESPRAMRQ
jgi:tetratricopeptide (TPR) repeat protein